jgi:RNA polymerase sigma-70 factor (ECF subfamily)
MGDDEASKYLADLYWRYGHAVYCRALSLLHGSDEAHDVTQDTFVAFMRNDALLRRAASPLSVLLQIVTYKSVDRLRRRARWSGTLRPLEVRDSEDPQDDQGSSYVHDGEMNRVEARQDLAILTQGEKAQTLTAVFLYFAEGHTMEEVAEVLDVSRRTASKLVRQFTIRARRRSSRLGAREAP